MAGDVGPILLVGNGASVSKSKAGSLIDAFPVVGRINNFRTAGFEDEAGTRTDIWFNGANQGLRPRAEQPSQVVVLIPPELLAKKGAAIHDRIRRRLGVDSGSYELANLDEVREFADRCGVARPTTGTMAILWAMSRYRDVCIHGFDFFIDSRSHYDDSWFKRRWAESRWSRTAHRHDVTAEKSFVEGLLERGELRRLSVA